MPFDSLVARAAAADVVLLAEQHNDAAAQAHAAQLVHAVLQRSPRNPALALEFLERDAQPLVDDHLAGLASEPAFLAALASLRRADAIVRRDLDQTSFDPRTLPDPSLPQGHQLAIQHARRAGAPVIAANAPRRYVRHIRQQGPDAYTALSPAQQALVEMPTTLTEGRYRERFMQAMTHMTAHTDAHAAPDPEALYLAQNIWDATMADSVANALEQDHRPVMLIVGQFHTDYNGGLVQRIAERHPSATIYTVSYQPVFAPALRDQDADRADAVVYTAPPPTPATD
jgi:uncharacterized iron-regulated protein